MSKPKVILTRKWPAAAEAKAKELFDAVINEDDHKMTVEELKQAMCEADALCPTVSDFQINSEIFNVENRKCKIVANFGVGFNNIDTDGAPSGRLSGLEVDDTGAVAARFTNGQLQNLGQIILANFPNKQGLTQLGDTTWGESFQSGTVRMGVAGTSDFGLIQSGALESSNVNLTEQLVEMISAQRNFEANAQVISTSDAITQQIINIR